MGKRFGLTYTDKEGNEKTPVIIHRAPLGSHERFIGFLIEHFGGAFPLWLSPIQVNILPITDRHAEAANQVAQRLKSRGIRAEVDDRSETLSAKIRDATLQKIPYLGIIGDKEVSSGGISVRTRDGKDLKSMSLESFTQKLVTEIEHKS